MKVHRAPGRSKETLTFSESIKMILKLMTYIKLSSYRRGKPLVHLEDPIFCNPTFQRSRKQPFWTWAIWSSSVSAEPQQAQRWPAQHFRKHPRGTTRCAKGLHPDHAPSAISPSSHHGSSTSLPQFIRSPPVWSAVETISALSLPRISLPTSTLLRLYTALSISFLLSLHCLSPLPFRPMSSRPHYTSWGCPQSAFCASSSREIHFAAWWKTPEMRSSSTHRSTSFWLSGSHYFWVLCTWHSWPARAHSLTLWNYYICRILVRCSKITRKMKEYSLWFLYRICLRARDRDAKDAVPGHSGCFIWDWRCWEGCGKRGLRSCKLEVGWKERCFLRKMGLKCSSYLGFWCNESYFVYCMWASEPTRNQSLHAIWKNCDWQSSMQSLNHKLLYSEALPRWRRCGCGS